MHSISRWSFCAAYNQAQGKFANEGPPFPTSGFVLRLSMQQSKSAMHLVDYPCQICASPPVWGGVLEIPYNAEQSS